MDTKSSSKRKPITPAQRDHADTRSLVGAEHTKTRQKLVAKVDSLHAILGTDQVPRDAKGRYSSTIMDRLAVISAKIDKPLDAALEADARSSHSPMWTALAAFLFFWAGWYVHGIF